MTFDGPGSSQRILAVHLYFIICFIYFIAFYVKLYLHVLLALLIVCSLSSC
ncbi:hypothetical protein Hanom_Chr10g00875031 [Helianthus anomalus]